MGERTRPPVYICHSGGDKEFAKQLDKDLREAGIHTWIDTRCMPSGEPCTSEMEKGIKQSCVVLMVLSQEFCQRVDEGVGAVSLEVGMALQRRMQSPSTFRLMGMKAEECQPPLRLHDTTGMWLDGTADNYANALDRLVRDVKRPPGNVRPPVTSTATRGTMVNMRPRHAVFCPREDELLSLSEILADHGRAVVCGSIGVGKTGLAREYAYRESRHYQCIMWVEATNLGAVSRDLASLAKQLGIDPVSHDVDSTMESVRTSLEKSDEKWLLIIDDVDDPRSIEQMLPVGNGHVVITSRNPVWGQPAIVLNIDPIPKSAAARFLCDRTRTEDIDVAEELATELGGLTLALEQAGGYCEATGISLQTYLEMYRARRRDLLRCGRPHDYTHDVWTTWDLALDRVEEKLPISADFLRLCAFLASDRIPLDLLLASNVVAGTPLEKLADPFERDKMLTLLRGHSLVKRVDHEVDIHRLGQSVIMDRLSEDDNAVRAWGRLCKEIVTRAFNRDGGHLESREHGSRLLPHALALLARARVMDVQTARLLNEVALYYGYEGASSEAIKLLIQALEIIESSPLCSTEPDHIDSAAALDELTRSHGEVDNLRNACRLLEDMRDPLLQRESSDTEDLRDCLERTRLNLLVMVKRTLAYQEYLQGNLSEAECLFVSVIELGDERAGFNFAYMIRRGEASSDHGRCLHQLLRAGVESRDPVCIANKALAMAVGVGCDQDWAAADRLFSQLTDPQDIVTWWGRTAQSGDPEGHMVLAWLARWGLQRDPDGLSLAQHLFLAAPGGWSPPLWFLEQPPSLNC